MRSHGVPNFPDPSPGGPSVIPNWINPQAPAFKSAEKACARYLGGGTDQRSGSVSEKLELLNLAKCMRAHGLPNFPDPTTSPPSTPPPGSHTGNAIGIAGAVPRVPTSIASAQTGRRGMRVQAPLIPMESQENIPLRPGADPRRAPAATRETPGHQLDDVVADPPVVPSGRRRRTRSASVSTWCSSGRLWDTGCACV